MSNVVYKIQHIPTGKFVSTTAHTYLLLWYGEPADSPFSILHYLCDGGKHYVNKKAAEKFLGKLNKTLNEFKLKELS